VVALYKINAYIVLSLSHKGPNCQGNGAKQTHPSREAGGAQSVVFGLVQLVQRPINC